MLAEEFKRCINSDVKSFLDEKEVETLEKAARLAVDFTLTRKVSFVRKANRRKPFYPPLVINQVLVSNLVILIRMLPKPNLLVQRSQSLISAYLQLLQTIRSYCFCLSYFEKKTGKARGSQTYRSYLLQLTPQSPGKST